MTTDPTTDIPKCHMCEAVPAHECFWHVEHPTRGEDYRLRAVLCAVHEKKMADHMSGLESRMRGVPG